MRTCHCYSIGKVKAYMLGCLKMKPCCDFKAIGYEFVKERPNRLTRTTKSFNGWIYLKVVQLLWPKVQSNEPVLRYSMWSLQLSYKVTVWSKLTLKEQIVPALKSDWSSAKLTPVTAEFSNYSHIAMGDGKSPPNPFFFLAN